MKNQTSSLTTNALLRQAIANGLYSDFTVVIDDTTYHLHRFVLADASGFFAGMFRVTPNETQVEFTGDHIMVESRAVWEELLGVWYKTEKHEKRLQHNLRDHTKISALYNGINQYLSLRTKLEPIWAAEKSFVFDDCRIHYDIENDILTISTSDVKRKWQRLRRSCRNHTTDNDERLSEIIVVLNRLIETKTDGGCVDLIKKFEILDKTYTLTHSNKKKVRLMNIGIRLNGEERWFHETSSGPSLELTGHLSMMVEHDLRKERSG